MYFDSNWARNNSSTELQCCWSIHQHMADNGLIEFYAAEVSNTGYSFDNFFYRPVNIPNQKWVDILERNVDLCRCFS